MRYTKELKNIEAQYPRQSEWATISPDDRLRVAYNLYTNLEKTDVPENERVILYFSHGNGMIKECWDYLIVRLLEKHSDIIEKVISVDSINQGDSHVLNEGRLGWLPHWADGGRDLIKIVKAEQTNAINILCGHSMGGTKTMYAASFEPSLFDSIILVDPVVHAEEGYDQEGEIMKLVRGRFRKLRRILKTEFKDKKEYEDYIRNKSMSATWIPEIQTAYMEGGAIYHDDGSVSFKTSHDQQMASYYTTVYAFRDALKLASCIDMEAMHIAGTVPTITTRRAAVECRKSLRHCVSVDIDDAGHLVPFEKPQETIDAISAFVTRRRLRAIERNNAFDARAHLATEQRREFFKKRLDEIHNTYPMNPLYSKL